MKGVQGVVEGGVAYVAASDPLLRLALRLDATVRQVRPNDWRGVAARERVIQQAL